MKRFALGTYELCNEQSWFEIYVMQKSQKKRSYRQSTLGFAWGCYGMTLGWHGYGMRMAWGYHQYEMGMAWGCYPDDMGISMVGDFTGMPCGWNEDDMWMTWE